MVCWEGDTKKSSVMKLKLFVSSCVTFGGRSVKSLNSDV